MFEKFVDICFKVYYWYRLLRQKFSEFILLGELSKIHIKISRVGFGLRLTILKHSVFIESLMAKLREFPDHHKNEKEWITYAFTEAFKGGNTLLFRKGKHTLLFWLNKHKVEWEYYHPKKLNLKLFYALMGVLVKYEFVRYPFVHWKVFALFSYPKYFTYYENDTDDYYEVKADFEKDFVRATEFILTVFDVIYKVKKEKLTIWVA